MNMGYKVKLDIFEGPLDLLLHLIHKNEVDIFDIPIATITDQYLEYLDMMRALNVNVAGDFLVMASTLIHIKSKMLLPELNEEDEEEDPRVEITRPLLEYMAFKEIAQSLSEKDMLYRDVFTRRLSSEHLAELPKDQNQYFEVSLFQLMDAFRQVVHRYSPKAELKYSPERWTVKQKAELILERLKPGASTYFMELFDQDSSVPEFVATFLALLELVHRGKVKIFQSAYGSDIRLTPSLESPRGEEGGKIPETHH